MNIKKLILVPVVLAAAGFAVPASAVVVVNVSNDGGANWKTCFDGQACDGSVVANRVAYNLDVFFAGWSGNLNVGSSNGPGTPQAAEIHLTSSLNATQAGNLLIWVYDTFDMPLGAGTLIFTGVGGETANASATGWGRKTDDFTFTWETDKCVVDLSINGGRCTSTYAHGAVPTASYYLDLFASVTATGNAGDFSLDFDVTNVPEPGSLALLGLGLLGFVGAARRRLTA